MAPERATRLSSDKDSTEAAVNQGLCSSTAIQHPPVYIWSSLVLKKEHSEVLQMQCVMSEA